MKLPQYKYITFNVLHAKNALELIHSIEYHKGRRTFGRRTGERNVESICKFIIFSFVY
jgi:hypothetical protein